MQRTCPNIVRIVLTIWIVLLVWGAWNLWNASSHHVQANWLVQSSLQMAATLIIVLGMAMGAGVTRWIAIALIAARIAALVSFAQLGAFRLAPFPWLSVTTLALEAMTIIALFLPPSSGWFRERSASLRSRAWYPFAIVLAFVCVIPAVAMNASTYGFIVLLWFFYVPALMFGRPHFAFGIGAGPADPAGWVLTAAFWCFIAVLAALILRAVFRRLSRGAEDASGRLVDRAWFYGGNAVLIACVVAMAVPLAGDRGKLKADLAARVEQERAVDAATVEQWPEVSGKFLIDDDGGKYGVRSSGTWRIAKGVLEIVADETTIWDRVPVCEGCGTLKSWRFVLRSYRGSSSGPTGNLESAEGFAPIPAIGAHVKVTDHRMRLPLVVNETVRASYGDARSAAVVKRTIPPAKLDNYWIGIDVNLGEGYYPANTDDVFMFSDALAEKGMVPQRCATPHSIAEAVERGCHDALAAMLSALPKGSPDIEKGDDRVRKYSRESRPIQIAVWKNDLRAAEMLLEAGADPNKPGWRDYTLLMNAVRDNKPDMTAMLARHGAKLDERQQRDFNMTALMMAAAEGESRVVAELLKAGADKTLRDRDGHTAYDYAAFRSHPETARLLK